MEKKNEKKEKKTTAHIFFSGGRKTKITNLEEKDKTELLKNIKSGKIFEWNCLVINSEKVNFVVFSNKDKEEEF